MVDFGAGDIAIILATLLGPVLAIQTQKWIEKASALRESRNHLNTPHRNEALTVMG